MSYPAQSEKGRPVSLQRELSEKDLVELRSRYNIPTSVILRRPKATNRANAPPPGQRCIFVVALENGLRLHVQPYVGRGVPFGFTSHPKSKGVLPKTAKHKADAIAFSTYWGDRRPMPLHFYTDHRVLKAASLSPIAKADLGALDTLRVSYSMPDHAPLSPLAIPAAALNQLPLRPLLSPGEITAPGPRGITLEPSGMGVGTSQCSREHLSASIPPSLQGQGLSPPPTANQALGDAPMDTSGQHYTTIVLNPEDQGDVGLEEDGIRPFQSSTVAIPKEVRKDPPLPPSPASPNHAELISSFSALGDKEASGSSSWAGQLEGELKALKKKKAREEGVMQCRLKNLAREHTTLQERYAASVCRTEAVRAELEGMQAKRDYTLRRRRAFLLAGMKYYKPTIACWTS
ncbi:hypothetical protein LIER_18413 [Lithospermum erythrorhizon]|uniref:Uncharacterized protein n=1 Tax=Lithospermum erythrorhizon TaxID=34254 RepID=A0AAV3QDV7_LITER